MPEDVKNLRAYKKWQENYSEELGDLFAGNNLVFEEVRHTHATLLLRQGVNPKIVQERLGHSSIKVTMDTYSHVLPDMQKQAIDALQGIFQ